MPRAVGYGWWWWKAQDAVLSKVLRIDFVEEVKLKLRLEGGEEISQADVWRKSILGRGSSWS